LIHALGGLENFTYKDEGDFVRWLSKIAENEIRGNLRKLHAEKRNIRREFRLDHSERTTGGGSFGNLSPIGATTPSVIMSRKEDLSKLEKAMDQLKPKYREAIMLTKIEGLSYEEIGERLDMSADAVRMVATRAMVALAAAFRRI
ncbi:MAG: sigma-70 family RNA polymerase sigma factor, partial [Planctomycetota bacterium]